MPINQQIINLHTYKYVSPLLPNLCLFWIQYWVQIHRLEILPYLPLTCNHWISEPYSHEYQTFAAGTISAIHNVHCPCLFSSPLYIILLRNCTAR